MVFLARRHGQHGFQRLVAVKVIRKDSNLPSIVSDRFLHEARLLGLLQHRGIVVADDVVELDRGTAIVMEYVPGLDLSDIMRLEGRKPGSVPVGWLAHVGLEVVTALHAAVARPSPVTGAPLRVMHLDLKPSNIRVTPDGTTKLLDFGVSTSSIDTTASGPMMGTVSYAAPERISDGLTVPSGDLFSLALTLLAVARGRPMRGRPLRPESLQEWMGDTIRSLPPAFEPLTPLLSRMSHINPSQRPSHTEARDELFDVFRRFARRPPADVSEALCTMVTAKPATRTLDATISDIMVPSPESLSAPPLTLSDVDPASIGVPARGTTGEVLITPPRLQALDSATASDLKRPPVIEPGALSVDETFVFQLQSATLDRGVEDPVLRLHATWFSGPGTLDGASAADSTVVQPPVMALANLGSFRDWLPLDTAMAVLEADEAVRDFPGGVCVLLEQMFQVGWLEPRRLGPVAAIRVAAARKGTAAHAWARVSRAGRSQVREIARTSLVAPYLDARLLVDVAHGAGLGHELARSVAEDLYASDVVATDVHTASVAALLSVRGGGSRSGAMMALRRVSARDALTAEERWQLRCCMAHVEALDPWVSGLDTAPMQGGSGSAEAVPGPLRPWADVLRASALRREGRFTEADMALNRVPLDHPNDIHSTVLARLELERAELLIRGGKYAEARAACARAMKAAHFTFVDLIKVRASCIEAESWLAAGQADKARPPAEQAVALADASGCPRALATALVTRGAVSLVHMDLSQAGADFNRAISVSPAEDVGLTALARAWTGGVLMVGGHPESAHALLGRAITAGAGVSLELAVLMHAWNARTLMVMEKPDGAEQSLRAAREALGQVRDALLPSIRMVFEEAEVVVGKTGVFRRSSSASKPKALR